MEKAEQMVREEKVMSWWLPVLKICIKKGKAIPVIGHGGP
jgi:hypothetical protein